MRPPFPPFLDAPLTWAGVLVGLFLLPHQGFLEHEVTRRLTLAGAMGLVLVLRGGPPPKAMAVVLGVVLVGAGRAWLGFTPWYGLYECLLLFTLLLLWASLRDRPLATEILAGTALALGTVALVAGRVWDGQWGPLPTVPLRGPVLNENVTAQAMALGAVGAAMLGTARKGPMRWGFAALGAVLAVHLVPQAAKTAWMALLAGLLGVMLTMVPRRWRWPLGVGGALAGMALALTLARGTPLQESKSLTERAWMATNAVMLIKDRPLVGHGPGQFPATNLAISPQVTRRWPGLQPHLAGVALTPHSELLGLTHDWGIPLVCLLALLLVYRLDRLRGREPLLAALGVLLLLDFPLHVSPLAVLFVLCTATVTPDTAPAPEQPALWPTTLPARLAGGALLVFALAVGQAEHRAWEGHRQGDWQLLASARLGPVLHPYAAKRAGTLLMDEGGAVLIPHEPTRLARAERLLTAALRGRATANTHNTLGVALKRQGKLRRAVLHFQTAVALEPRHCIAYENLGYTYHALGEKGAAEDAFTAHRACLARGRA